MALRARRSGSFVVSRHGTTTCWAGNRGVDDEAVVDRTSADQVCRSSLRCMQGHQREVLDLARSEAGAVGQADNGLAAAGRIPVRRRDIRNR